MDTVVLFNENQLLRTDLLCINRSALHWHSNAIEIIHILKGRAVVKQGFSIISLAAGEFVFINKKTVHCVWCEDNPCVVEIVYLNIDALKAYYPEIGELWLGNMALKEISVFDLKLFEMRKTTFRLYLIEILSASLNNAGSIDYQDFKEKCLHLVLMSLREYNQLLYIIPAGNNTGTGKIERFLRILKFVNDNIEEKINFDDIARDEKVGKSYLSNMWKELTGITFGDFVNLLRVHYAESLLFSGKRIIDISHDSGFSDPKYFYQSFRMFYGDTPMAWKKRWESEFNKKSEINRLEPVQAQELISAYWKEFLTDVHFDSRIYQQYLMLKSINENSFPKTKFKLEIDLFSPENVLIQNSGSNLEWQNIDLLFGQLDFLGINSCIRIQTELLKDSRYMDGLMMNIHKQLQYGGIIRARSNTEYHFICKDMHDINLAVSIADRIQTILRGGTYKIILK